MRLRLLLTLLLAACAPLDVVVAELPPLGDGGRPMPDRPCSSNTDCTANDYCDKPTCDTLIGNCRRRPLFCPTDPQPTCGCNGVTYWNGCVRGAQGIEASTPGECTTGTRCGGDAGLCADPEASCALLLPSTASCAVEPVGACWVLPPMCAPPTAGTSLFEECGAGPGCKDLCAAIRAGVPHRRSLNCQ